MDRARLDAWLARAIIGLLIAMVVTAVLAMGALRDQEFFWLQILGIVAGLLWLWRLWLVPTDRSRRREEADAHDHSSHPPPHVGGYEHKIFLPPITWPLLAFCAYAIIRYFTADLEYLARKEFVRVVLYMLFFLLCLNHFQNARVRDVAVGILIVLGMALSVYALRQYLTGTNAIWHYVRPGYAFRGSGTFIYPNHFAGFAEMLLGLGLGYVFLGSMSKWMRLFLAYCSLWLVLGIYLSFSRAGWIATLLSLLFLLPVLLRNRQRQVIAFGLFVTVLISVLAWELKTGEIAERLKNLGRPDLNSGLNVRPDLWSGAIKIWQTNPLWGAGPAHFEERFRAYRPPPFQWRAGQTHCDYLNVLADWGAVGVALLGCALALYAWPLARHWFKTVRDPTDLNRATTNHYALTCGGFAGTIALLAHSAVDYQWYAPGVMLTFITIIAMLACQTQSERWHFALRIPASLLIVPVVIFLAYQGSKTVREHHWLDQVKRTNSLEARIALLERALAVELTNFETAYRIGEHYRLRSSEGAEDYRELAAKAMEWFDRASRLNPFDPFPPMRKAMCLDWLKRPAEAEVALQKALALDPHHYLVLAIAGWHFYQVGDDKQARHYLYESLARNWRTNPTVFEYLRLLDQRSPQK